MAGDRPARPRFWRRRIARWSFRAEIWLARRFDIGMVVATVLDDRVLAVTITWIQSPPKLPWWTWLVRAAPIVPGGPITGWRAISVMDTYAKFEPDVPHGNLWVSAADPGFKGAAHRVWLYSFRHLGRARHPDVHRGFVAAVRGALQQLRLRVRERMTLRTGHEVLGMWRDVGAGDFADLPVRRRA